jgi:hypothetical protein
MSRETAMAFVCTAPLYVLGALLCVWPLVGFTHALNEQYADAFVMVVAWCITALATLAFVGFTKEEL